MKVSSKRLKLDHLVEGREENDIVHLSDSGKWITMDRMLEKMKIHERVFPISKYSQHLIHGDKEFILHYECKAYWITDVKGEMLTPKLPAASKEMFYYVIHVRQKDLFLERDHIQTYIGIKFGERAHNSFWTTITEDEVLDLLMFEVRYIHDVDSLNKARAVTHSELANINIPARIMTLYGIKFYQAAALARGAEIIEQDPWLMHNLPKNYRDILTDVQLIQAIDWILNRFDIKIDSLKTKHLQAEKMTFIRTELNGKMGNIKEAHKAFTSGNTNIDKWKTGYQKPINVSSSSDTHLIDAQH